MSTEEYFGQSGVHLFDTIINKGGPFSETARYIVSNNSAEEINIATNKLIDYLKKNNFTYEDIIDPDFFTKYEVDGMVGGMPIKPILAAVLITVNVVSGADTFFGSILQASERVATRTFIAATHVARGIVLPVAEAAKLVPEVYESFRSTNDEELAVTLAELNAAKQKKEEAEQANADLQAKNEELKRIIAQREKADVLFIENAKKVAVAVVIGIVTTILAVMGLKTVNNCKTKKGDLPEVDYTKINRTKPKYGFRSPKGTKFRFKSLQEACDAALEGYPLYFDFDGNSIKIATWQELNTAFDEGTVVFTKNDDFKVFLGQGGTKRRRRRRSTKRKL